MSGGAFHAYAGIWFNSFGFTANQIAALSTVPTFLLLLINAFAGRIADRASDWRKALVLGSFVSFLASCGLVFVSSYAAILLFWSASLVAQSLIVPIGDGAALYLTRQGRGQVGTFRSLSTAGYIVALFLTGLLILQYGGSVFALLFASMCGVRFAASVIMPDFKTATEQHTPSALPIISLLRTSWLMLPLVGWAIVYSTLQVLSSFFALHLSKQGHDEGTISLLIATGALAEAVVFLMFRHFSERFDLRLLIFFSCAVTVLRWVAMTYEPSLPVLYALQTSHGICFALGFIACITYISRNTPPENTAETQSLFTVVQMVSSIATITIYGRLVEGQGAQAFWGLVLIAGLGTVLSIWSLWFTPPAPTGPDLSGSHRLQA